MSAGPGGAVSGRPAVFFDRDGTLMREVSYCRDAALVETPPGLREALAALREAGFARVIVTNQSGIGRGWIAMSEYEAVQAELMRQIGGEMDAVYMCPDPPGVASERRKPEPGMLFEAARELGLDLSRSYMIGDKAGDVEAGRRAGVREAMLVRTGYGAEEEKTCPPGTRVFADVLGAIDFVLQRASGARS